MLNAMSQGRSGSMCTIHADSSAGVFRRIASYAVQAPERLPLEAANLLIAGAIHFVVYLDTAVHDPTDGDASDQILRDDDDSLWPSPDDGLSLGTEVEEEGSLDISFPPRSARTRF